MRAARNIFTAAKAIQGDVAKELGPPEGDSFGYSAFLASVVRGTRGYIERVTNQINGAYKKGLVQRVRGDAPQVAGDVDY